MAHIHQLYRIDEIKPVILEIQSYIVKQQEYYQTLVTAFLISNLAN